MPLRPTFIASLLLFTAGAASSSAATPSTLRQVQWVGVGDSTALELRLSAPVITKTLRLANPNRLVVDLLATRQVLRSALPKARAPITALRLAARAGDTLRLVLELPAGINADLAPTAIASTGESLLKIVFRTDSESAASVVSPATTGAAAAPAMNVAITAPHAPASSGRDIVIAIDAGHGGDDPGASGRAGTQEKTVTLAIAKALVAQVNETPGMRAILTRSNDQFVRLRDRTARARNARADMFVSIHADAVKDREVEGASVYTLSDRGASSEAARFLADRENAADLRGVSLANQSDALATVLVDLSQSAAMGSSTEAAEVVLRALDNVGAVRKPVVQHAGFVVLKSPDMPSMLIETAYISNPAEERKLRSSAYQQQLASSIARGVVGYFRDHPPDGTRFAAERRSGKTVVVASNDR